MADKFETTTCWHCGFIKSAGADECARCGLWDSKKEEYGRVPSQNTRDYAMRLARATFVTETYETVDTVEVVRRRLADGRAIADTDVHRLVAEIDRLREQVRSMGGNA